MGSLLEAVRDQISPRAAALVLIAVAVTATATFGSRWWVLHRALQHRAGVCRLLPTDTFDPSSEDVLQHAGTILSRVHRVTRSTGVQRAHAVRIRLALEDGRLAYLMEGHDRARSHLRRSGYRQVEALPVAEPAGDEPVDPAVSDLEATPPPEPLDDDDTLELGSDDEPAGKGRRLR